MSQDKLQLGALHIHGVANHGLCLIPDEHGAYWAFLFSDRDGNKFTVGMMTDKEVRDFCLTALDMLKR